MLTPSTEVTLTVTPQELRALSDAIGELKYSVAAPLVAKLNAQLQAQSKPPEPASPANPPLDPQFVSKADEQEYNRLEAKRRKNQK